jgi:hypothetical protein
VGTRTPAERPRAFGLIAIVLAMLGLVTAIGLSRSGFGPGMGLSSRYITLTLPLLSALYIAWLLYGPARLRWGIHLGLLVLVGLSVPANVAFGLRYGGEARAAELKVERGLKMRLPASEIMKRACPGIYPDPKIAFDHFRRLKAARIGAFVDFDENRVTAAQSSSGAVRR